MEGLVDRMEQSSSPAVMAEAVREIKRLMEEVSREKDQATVRRLSAVRSQNLLRDRLLDLEGKARFAMSEGREDLAEVALSRQIDFESTIVELDQTIAQAREEEDRFATAHAELKQRHDTMAESLRAYEAALTQVDQSAPAASASRGRAADRAEDAFRRAMGGSAEGIVAAAVADEETRKGLGEIDQMSRRKNISERMDKLRLGLAS
jgi:phage shock protein A